MLTLAKFFEDTTPAPYDKSLTGKVIFESEPVVYKNAQEETKKLKTVALADNTKTVKLICYDASKFSKLVSGNCLKLRNVVKRDGCIILTTTSRIFPVSDFPVESFSAAEGEALVHPLPAPVVTLEKALSSPPKLKVSVTGKVVQVVTLAIDQKKENDLERELSRIGVSFRFWEERGDDKSTVSVKKWSQPTGTSKPGLVWERLKDAVGPLMKLSQKLQKDGITLADSLLWIHTTIDVIDLSFTRLNALTPLSGGQAVYEMVRECPGLQRPGQITTTTLRKYIATVSHVITYKL